MAADARDALAAPIATIVTVASVGRAAHVARQHEGLDLWAPDVRRVVVQIGDRTWPIPGADIVDCTGPGPVRLGEARNAGAAAALSGHSATGSISATAPVDPSADASNADTDSADPGLLVFLDADCVPAPGLVDRYLDAATRDPGAVLCGPVTYLAEGTGEVGVAKLPALIDPHPARPDPPAGTLRRATEREYDLFWLLSFAVTAATWRRIADDFGGFHEGYAGYGAEDTDFGAQLLAHGIPLTWVGGAHALHQWHPVSSPPVEHLDDILRNGALFRDRHGRWPMEGWLRRFEEMGLVRRDGGDWVRADG